MNRTKDTKELTNKILVNIMVNCMLNPDNEDFYIGKLSKEKLEYYINTNKGMEHIYREAYAKACKENDNIQSIV